MSLTPRVLHEVIRPQVKVLIEHMTPGELQEMRTAISLRLGDVASLENVNLQEKVVIQLAQMESLLQELMGASDVPANQKAQVANSIHGLIAQLVKWRTDLFQADRISKLEGALLDAIKKQPDEVKDKFMEVYRELLEKADQ